MEIGTLHAFHARYMHAIVSVSFYDYTRGIRIEPQFSPPFFVGYAIVVSDVPPLLDWPVQTRPVGQL